MRRKGDRATVAIHVSVIFDLDLVPSPPTCCPSSAFLLPNPPAKAKLKLMCFLFADGFPEPEQGPNTE